MNTPSSPYHNGSPQHHPHQSYHQPHHVPQQQHQSPQAPVGGFKYNNPNIASANPTSLYPPMSRLMYVPPLTPPSSEPGSPGGTMQGPPRRTPPPPYPAPVQPGINSVGNVGSPTVTRLGHVKYNRRNNPELEKRRVHHCDFLGEFFLYISKFLVV